jgi:hypothetical protein
MPKILEGVKEDDEMIGGVNTMKYLDHDVEDSQIPRFGATQLHGE